MRKAVWRFACCLLLMLLLVGVLPATAAEPSAADQARSLLDGIIACRLRESGTASVQDWLDGALAEQAGESAEWYVIALRQQGEYDFSAYAEALQRYLSTHADVPAVTRQKYALAHLAANGDMAYVAQTVNDSIGQLGVMSWVWGLHLLNNGCIAETHTVDSVIEGLLDLQLDDGGWAIAGEHADVDATAMAVQALAPHVGTHPAVEAAVDRALERLSAHQTETGEYLAYGVPNPESAAQVIIALSALGIDCTADARFVKDGETLLGVLGRYRLADGSFCHQAGGASNEHATMQVFCAAVAYLRMTEGKSGLYIFAEPLANTTDTVPAPQTQAAPAETETDHASAPPASHSITLFLCLAIAGIAAVACVVLLCAKRRNGKNVLLVLAIAAVAVTVVLLADIQTVSEYYADTSDFPADAVGTVTITIRCDTIAGQPGAAHVPADGVILEVCEWPIAEGDTVYDVLLAATAANRIHLETSGSAGSIYVEGIANLYAFAFGDLSGWVYRVNGETILRSCGEYGLSDGDAIAWLYTCALGEDLDAGE